MKGHPKYKIGEKVRFGIQFAEGPKPEKTGTIYVVDPNGVLGDDIDVSYDILVEEENTLYKHIREDFVTKEETRNN